MTQVNIFNLIYSMCRQLPYIFSSYNIYKYYYNLIGVTHRLINKKIIIITSMV